MIDEQRFERTWRRYGGSVLRYCRFTTGSAETAEDLAAEAFARFLQKGSRVPDEQVEAWLFTVARNLCMSHHRREARGRSLLPRLTRPEVSVVEESSTLGEAAAALVSLTEVDRLAVYLRVVEERPFAEVARIVGTSEEAAKKRVARALVRLRRILDATTALTPSIDIIGG